MDVAPQLNKDFKLIPPTSGVMSRMELGNQSKMNTSMMVAWPAATSERTTLQLHRLPLRLVVFKLKVEPQLALPRL